jgi:di/tricarboxylate transporter
MNFPATFRNNSKFLPLALSGLGLILLLCIPNPTSRAAILAVLSLSFLATAIMPEHITALLFFLLAMLFSITSSEVIFSGFSSAAVWLVFGGLIIGSAINATGLGTRTARTAATWLHGSYVKIISGLVTASLLFSFLMPSAMGRVVLLTPIAVSIAEHFGFHEGRKGRTGILLAVILGTYIPAFGVLPANVPNMVLAGMAETQYHLSFFYGSYLLLHFPVLSLIKALLIIGFLIVLYHDQPHPVLTQKENTSEPFSRNEKILTTVLLVMLCLWMTDFLHHISPAWIALAGALVLLMPGVDIVSRPQFNQKINWSSIIFVAGILGLGNMINKSGLGHSIAAAVTNLLPIAKQQDFVNYMSVSTAAAATGMVATLPAVPAVFTPLTASLAHTTDLPIQTLLMMQVVGFSTIVFPYQAPPIVVGLQMAGEKPLVAAKITIPLALISLFCLVPLNYFWWKFLDWL